MLPLRCPILCFLENCAANWFYYERHCYRLFVSGRGHTGSHQLHHNTAATNCLKHAAHLISFRDAAEESNVKEYIHAFGATSKIWTGLRFRNGNFTSDQGQPMIFTRWATGQPVLGHVGGDCVYTLYHHSKRTAPWYVTGCGGNNQYFNYLCKKPSGKCAGL